ncbi:CocE/NonD family hydrolase [Niveispirillum sp. KHB5.9]|uniref:CocE/NonD family hydrolase n=1 Tax=Niveispirillum sp. KHB5.9 TaxID=3400269 RepID=UPI003A8B892F
MTHTVTDLPFRVETRELFIAMTDGVRLAATLWLPVGAGPVPALVELLPYRRRDGTIFRDARNQPYIAGHGYACLRVDIRGAGDSDGLLADEYLPLEQEDACNVIEWAASQPWCSGAVGMWGLSWGGFNGLQAAARRPKGLKAIISMYASDDRYADDVHFMGGSLLTEDPMWSVFMLALNATPPDPAIAGPGWRETWMKRLEANRCWSEVWLAHQSRDEYWRQGSVCEDYGAIDIPVLAVAGWDDSYSNAMFRLLANLPGPRKGLVGPWSHVHPHLGSPGPRIGFLQETIRWWDHWLKGIDNGVMDEPMLRAWINDPKPPRPFYEDHPGSWVAEPCWPPRADRDLVLHLNDGRLHEQPCPGPSLHLRSPATAGRDCGRWGGYGGDAPDMAIDQRREDGTGLCFDTSPLEADLVLLGAPVVELVASSHSTQGTVTARLCAVAPDGTSALLTWGTLNLAFRDGFDTPKPLEPGRPFTVRLAMNEIGTRVPAGHRLRLSLSNQHWPILWPQPGLACLDLTAGVSRLRLPARPDSPLDASLRPLEPAAATAPVACVEERPVRHSRQVMEDVATGEQTIDMLTDFGRYRLSETGLVCDHSARDIFTIRPDDPRSAHLTSAYTIACDLGDAAMGEILIQARVDLSADEAHFHLDWRVHVHEGGTLVHGKSDHVSIPRRGM